MLSIINNNGTHTVHILNTRYTKTEVDTLISTSDNKAETGNLLNQKVNTSGNNIISSSLEANVFRCCEIKVINDDDLNALTLTQLTANESIIDLRTEEPYADMDLKVKGLSYIGLPTTNTITLHKDTAIYGVLTTGSTTIHRNLTLTGNLKYNGDTTISGTLDAQRLYLTNSAARPIEINNTMHNGPYIAAISQNYSNNYSLFALRCLPLNQLWCFGVSTSNQYNTSHENSTKLSIQSNGDTTINENSDVGTTQAQTSIKAYVNHAGYQGNIQIEPRWRSQGFIHFSTNYPEGLLLFAAR